MVFLPPTSPGSLSQVAVSVSCSVSHTRHLTCSASTCVPGARPFEAGVLPLNAALGEALLFQGSDHRAAACFLLLLLQWEDRLKSIPSSVFPPCPDLLSSIIIFFCKTVTHQALSLTLPNPLAGPLLTDQAEAKPMFVALPLG